jgi:uncharacterized protein YqjF (DUF2071 family)
VSTLEPIEHPDGWLTEQRELTVCFLHWKVATDVVRSLVPDGLDIDLLDGQAWVSMSPHLIKDAHMHDLPPMRWLDDEWFEVELRTYVVGGGVPGVWFFSFDASDGVFWNWVRSHVLHLSYNASGVAIAESGATFHATSARPSDPDVAFDVQYTPQPKPAGWTPSPTETWLTERYSMFVKTGFGTLDRGDIAHVPWPLQPVEVDVRTNTIPQAAGLPALGNPDLASYASGVVSRNWPLVPAISSADATS